MHVNLTAYSKKTWRENSLEKLRDEILFFVNVICLYAAAVHKQESSILKGKSDNVVSEITFLKCL